MRIGFSLLVVSNFTLACGSSTPPASSAGETPPAETSAPEITSPAESAKSEAPAPSATPAETPAPAPKASAAPAEAPAPAAFSKEEEAEWKKGEAKLGEAAKKAGKACGATLTATLPKDRWTGKVLAASGPDALAGGGLPVCVAGLDAVADVCKKDAKLKKAFAGWIKEYRCWPAAGPSVGTSNEAFELAFLLPGRTAADYKKMAAESLEASLKAAAK